MARSLSFPFFLRGLAAAAGAFVVCAGVATLLIGQERDRLVAQESERLGNAAYALAARLEDGLYRWLADARDLSKTTAFIAAAHDAGGGIGAGRDVLEALQGRSPEYAWIGIVRPSGVVATGSGGLLEGVDISNRPVFQGGVGGPFLGDIHAAVLLERLLRERRPDIGTAPLLFVDAAVPIPGAPGGPDGVAAIHIDWQWSARARQSALAAYDGASAPDILIVDASGRVVLGDAPATEPDGTWLTARAATGAVAGHPGLGWSVVARSEMAAVLAPLPAIRFRYAIIALIVGLTSLAGTCAWQTPLAAAFRHVLNRRFGLLIARSDGGRHDAALVPRDR